MIGQQHIVDSKAHRGNQDQDKENGHAPEAQVPGLPDAHHKPNQQKHQPTCRHTVARCRHHIHLFGNKPGQDAAARRAAGIEQDHPVAKKGNARKQTAPGGDADGQNPAEAQKAAGNLFHAEGIVLQKQSRQNNQEK